MTTAIAKFDYTNEQVELIKRTICQGATPDEFTLFIGQCKRTGLDPFSRQIHAVKRWDSKAKREVMSIQVGVDGFRLIADRTGQVDGQEGPKWCDGTGAWYDVWVPKEPPTAAKVTVFRKGHTHGYVGVAHWYEYCQTFNRDGKTHLSPMWAKMPALMLAKCAECLALRKAFPQELSGIYSPEESSQNFETVNFETKIDAAALQEINGLIQQCEAASVPVNLPKFLELYEIERVEDLPACRARDAVAALRSKLTQAKKAGAA